MKKQFTLCLLCLLCLSLSAQVKDTLQLDTLRLPSRGGQIPMRIDNVSKVPWDMQLVNPSDWMTAEKKDSTCILLNLQPNRSDEPRYQIMRMFSTEKEELILIMQMRYDFTYNDKEQTQWIPFAYSSPTWKATVDEEAASWAYAVRHGDDVIMLYLTPNTSRESRSLTLTASDLDKELFSYSILQLPDPLPVSQTEYTVGDGDSEISLQINLPEEVRLNLPQWIQLKSTEQADDSRHYVFSIQANNSESARADTIRLSTMDGKAHTEIPVFQYKHALFTPEGVEALCDTPVKVSSGVASSAQPGEGIELSFDGNASTIYHSQWDNSTPEYFPITLDYHFSQPEDIDYLEYIPRSDGGVNGLFEETDIFVQTVGNKEYQLVMNYDFNSPSAATRVDFPKTMRGVTSVRFVVKSGAGIGCGFASCAEMNFYRNSDVEFNYKDVFTDASCSTLKKGITEKKIRRIKQPFFRNLALHLLKGEYDEFRIQEYRAWPDPDKQAQQNGTRPFSMLDNPTGIAVREGEPLIVFVDGKNVPDSLQLLIQYLSPMPNLDDFGGPTYFLHKGMNVIKPLKSGLCYLIYRSETPETAEPVKVNFAGGYVNGYFDSTRDVHPDGSTRWEELLSKAGNKYFDIVSPYVHFTLRVSDYRKYIPDPLALLAAYDTLCIHEQEFQGFRKYGRMAKNRLYMHTSYREGMLYAAPYHIGFSTGMQGGLLDVNTLKTTECWGPAHELGHILQISPALCWTAMTEVTNNILSMEVQRHWGNPSRLHQKEFVEDPYNDTYERAMNVAFVQQNPYAYLTDWFDLVIPFWQLRLYVMDVCGKADFYKDVYEASIRAGHEKQLSSGEWQLEFIYNCCVAADMDLRPFFGKWGWLKPTERVYDDYYGKDSIAVTTEHIELLNKCIEALQLSTPVHAAEYITDNTLQLYKHPRPIAGGTATIDSEAATVLVKGAEGAVAYEVYCDNRLVRVSHNPSFRFPDLKELDVDKISVASVAPDGKRETCTIVKSVTPCK